MYWHMIDILLIINQGYVVRYAEAFSNFTFLIILSSWAFSKSTIYCRFWQIMDNILLIINQGYEPKERYSEAYSN